MSVLVWEGMATKGSLNIKVHLISILKLVTSYSSVVISSWRLLIDLAIKERTALPFKIIM